MPESARALWPLIASNARPNSASRPPPRRCLCVPLLLCQHHRTPSPPAPTSPTSTTRALPASSFPCHRPRTGLLAFKLPRPPPPTTSKLPLILQLHPRPPRLGTTPHASIRSTDEPSASMPSSPSPPSASPLHHTSSPDSNCLRTEHAPACVSLRLQQLLIVCELTTEPYSLSLLIARSSPLFFPLSALYLCSPFLPSRSLFSRLLSLSLPSLSLSLYLSLT